MSLKLSRATAPCMCGSSAQVVELVVTSGPLGALIASKPAPGTKPSDKAAADGWLTEIVADWAAKVFWGKVAASTSNIDRQ